MLQHRVPHAQKADIAQFKTTVLETCSTVRATEQLPLMGQDPVKGDMLPT